MAARRYRVVHGRMWCDGRDSRHNRRVMARLAEVRVTRTRSTEVWATVRAQSIEPCNPLSFRDSSWDGNFSRSQPVGLDRARFSIHEFRDPGTGCALPGHYPQTTDARPWPINDTPQRLDRHRRPTGTAGSSVALDRQPAAAPADLDRRPRRRQRPAATCASRSSSVSPRSSSRCSPSAAASPPRPTRPSPSPSTAQVQEVSTLAGSVEGALDSAGITISEHDIVAPAVDTEISDGSQIVVERGRLLTLTIDGQTREVWTTATTVEEALLELGQNPDALHAVRRPVARDPARRSRAVRRHPLQRNGFRRRCRADRGADHRPPRSATCSPSRASSLGPFDTVSPGVTTAADATASPSR